MPRPTNDEDDFDDHRTDRRYLKPHRGLMVLLLGIFGFKTCGVLGIVAFILGRNDLRQMDAGRMDPSGRGMTQIGYYLGIVATIFGLFVIAFVTLYIVAVVAMGLK